jgi:tetratricopeptide (TPR) repeat protein
LVVVLLALTGFATTVYAAEIPDLLTNAVSAYQQGHYDLAIDDFSQLIQLNVREAYFGRAKVYYKKHDYDRAIDDLNHVIQRHPMASALELRGDAYFQKANYQKALPDYNAAIQLRPQDPELYVSRADVFFFGGDPARALADYSTAIQLKTTNALAYAHRGELYAAFKGDYTRGIADCVAAIRLDPNCWLGYNNLAALLSVCPEAGIRDGYRALINARRACELTDWKNPLPISVLAGAYAETHDFDDAINWQEKSIDMQTDDGTLDPTAQIRLDLYQHHKPYHAAKSH